MTRERSTVPVNVQRLLWAESCGLCSNPDCMQELIGDTTEPSIGVMAHIVPHVKGGEVSFENMILLCQNCHAMTEPFRVEGGTEQLRVWKDLVQERNAQQFLKKFPTFEHLEQQVRPIIERNHLIFQKYGPESENAHPSSTDTFHLWQVFENELVANNSRLKYILSQNLHLFHRENEKKVREFLLHIDEFQLTRGDQPIVRVVLFPNSILSMFGIEPESSDPSPNLAALQNLIVETKRCESFIDLRFFPDPVIEFSENGKPICLSLNDRSRVDQIYYSRRLYRPIRTSLRYDTLLFYLNYFRVHNIEYEIEDYCDLTTITLNGVYRVKLLYSYIVSKSDVISISLSAVNGIVNAHNWNGGPWTEEAVEYVESIGVKVYKQTQFFAFCHAELK